MDYTTSVAYNYNETTKQYTKCYPLTHMNAVYTKDDESETLGNKLADIDNTLDDNTNKLGVLSGLETNYKNDLVGAINENTAQLSDIALYPSLFIQSSDDGDYALAINRAIVTASNSGGGSILLPNGIIPIKTQIILNVDNVKLIGNGHGSVIKVVSSSDIYSAIKLASNGGSRGATLRDFKIDCNNICSHGLNLSAENSVVVQRLFENIKIINATDYGFIVNGTQNSLFTLMQIEDCKGGIKLINGSGNNVFMKCEVNNTNGLPKLFVGEDSVFPHYMVGESGVFTRPSYNSFYSCVFERGVSDRCIYIQNGESNNFKDCVFSTDKVTIAGIEIESGILNSFESCTQTHYNISVVPIINRSYKTKFLNCFVNNSYTTSLMDVYDITIIEKIQSNTEPYTIRNFNINTIPNAVQYNSAGIYRGSSLIASNETYYPGQFIYDLNDTILFQGKQYKNYLVTHNDMNYKAQTTNFTNISNATDTVQLPYKGIWKVYITAYNGDRSHAVIGIYNLVCNNAGTITIGSVQQIGSNFIKGTSFTNLTATVTPDGIITIVVTASSTQSQITIQTKAEFVDKF